MFREPWEAQAFAMTLALHERGLFTWTEWADALSSAIKRAQAAGDCDDGSTYYEHWLAALETLVGTKGIAFSPGRGLHLSDDLRLNYLVAATHASPQA